MKRGSRVRTPAGNGTVLQIQHDTEWTFQKPRRVVWINVQVDGDPTPHTFSSTEVDELDDIEWPE